MKKTLLILISILILSGCSHSEAQESSYIPSQSQESSVAESTEEISFVEFPKGLSTYSKDKLKYTDGSITVIFTDEFFIQNKSYPPKSGVYLQNADGTATLLIEKVDDKTVTNEEMLAYLYENYPYSEISSAENGDIISWYIVTDKTAHNVVTLQKIRLAENGYHQICLNCRQADMEKYRKIFTSINFS